MLRFASTESILPSKLLRTVPTSREYAATVHEEPQLRMWRGRYRNVFWSDWSQPAMSVSNTHALVTTVPRYTTTPPPQITNRTIILKCYNFPMYLVCVSRPAKVETSILQKKQRFRENILCPDIIVVCSQTDNSETNISLGHCKLSLINVNICQFYGQMISHIHIVTFT